VGFAGARAADEDRVALGVEEGAGGEFANLALIDRGVSAKTNLSMSSSTGNFAPAIR
jgi:hypothetical protein